MWWRAYHHHYLRLTMGKYNSCGPCQFLLGLDLGAEFLGLFLVLVSRMCVPA